MRLYLTGKLDTGVRPAPDFPQSTRTDITFPLGVNLLLTVTVYEPNWHQIVLVAPVVGESPVPGDALVCTVRKSPSDQPLISKAATIDTHGAAVFTLLPADTKALDAGKYIWDVWLTDKDGNRNPVIPLSGLTLEAVVTPIP
jgi:hypothetical protein